MFWLSFCAKYSLYMDSKAFLTVFEHIMLTMMVWKICDGTGIRLVKTAPTLKQISWKAPVYFHTVIYRCLWVMLSPGNKTLGLIEYWQLINNSDVVMNMFCRLFHHFRGGSAVYLGYDVGMLFGFTAVFGAIVQTPYSHIYYLEYFS